MTDEERKELTPDEWADELAKRLGTTDIAAIRMFWQVAYRRGTRDAVMEVVDDPQDWIAVELWGSMA